MARTRQAALITCAALGMATLAPAQPPTYKLKVSAVGAVDDNGTTNFFKGTAQVTSSPGGINCRSELVGSAAPSGTCTTDFPAGTAVTLTATPLFGGTFDGWTGACAGQGVTCQLQMTTDLETATRTIAQMVTLTVIGDGNALGHVNGVDDFGSPRIACTIRGTQTSGVCESDYPSGQMAWLGRGESVTSIAQFSGWLGCGTVDLFNCRMVMNGSTSVTAGWIAPEIVVGSNGGNGSGKVTGAAPPGAAGPFDCTITPTGAAGMCSALWESSPPFNIQLSPTPIGNSVFRGWVSDWCTLVEGSDTCFLVPPNILGPPGRITRRMEVRAVFEIPAYALSIVPAGSGSGRVSSNPAGVDCVIAAGVGGADCVKSFSPGTALTLTADPTGGSTFGGWASACSGAQPTCAFVITADAQATARFNPPRPAAELARALLGGLTLSADEQRELDRFGNKDGIFNLGDLLALLARTGERVSPSATSALMQSQASGAVRRYGRSQ